MHRSYGYAINNDLISLEHTFDGSSVAFAYSFNKVHQVTETTADNEDFVFKPTALRKTRYAAANNLNQYPAVNGGAVGYDQNGNLESGVLDATFDPLNRITGATDGVVTNTYWTDPLDRQAQKEVDSTKTLFLHDGVQLIADYDDTPTLQNRYIPGSGLDEILIQISGSDTTFLHKDRLGSVIAQTDDTGAVLNKYVYAPFGRTPDLTGTIFGFTGQRYDAELGLYNYRARYNSPGIGRFLQPDPLGYGAGDMNLYTYVGNDPPNNTDPLGQCTAPTGPPPTPRQPLRPTVHWTPPAEPSFGPPPTPAQPQGATVHGTPPAEPNLGPPPTPIAPLRPTEFFNHPDDWIYPYRGVNAGPNSQWRPPGQPLIGDFIDPRSLGTDQPPSDRPSGTRPEIDIVRRSLKEFQNFIEGIRPIRTGNN